MALEFVGYASASSGSTGTYSVSLTSLTGGIGSSAQAGDLVVVASVTNSGSNDDPGVDTAGYTEVADLYANDIYDANLSVSWKVMGGTPDASVTVRASGTTGRGSACVVHVWRGVDTSQPLDVTTTTATGINGADATHAAITPVTSGAVVLACMGAATSSAGGAKTAPAGYGNALSEDSSAVRSAVAGIASKAWSSGSESPGSWSGGTSSTADSWGAATLALRPAADSGAYSLAANAGSYSYTGSAATLTYTPVLTGYTLAADGGGFTVTGQPATLRAGRSVSAGAGSYSAGGTSAGLAVNRHLAAAGGAYSLSGSDAGLVYVTGYRMGAESGSYALSGSDAGLSYNGLSGQPTGSPSAVGGGGSFEDAQAQFEAREASKRAQKELLEAEEPAAPIKRERTQEAPPAARKPAPALVMPTPVLAAPAMGSVDANDALRAAMAAEWQMHHAHAMAQAAMAIEAEDVAALMVMLEAL